MKRLIRIILLAVTVISGAGLARADEGVISLTEGSFTIIKRPDAMRILSSDPGVSYAEKLAAGTFKITAVRSGSSFVYFFLRDGGLDTAKVTVKDKVLFSPVPAEGPQKAVPLRFGYNLLSYGGSSQSPYDSGKWAYGGFFTQLKASGDTPFGRTNSFIQYEGKDGKTQVSSIVANLQDRDMYILAGDADVNMTDLTLNYFHYQGGLFKKDLSRNMGLTLAAGKRGRQMWGGSVTSDMRKGPDFIAAKTEYNPDKSSRYALTLVSSSGESGSGRLFYSLSGSKDIFKGISANAELVGGGSGLAAKIGGKLAFPGLYMTGEYKNVPFDYDMPVDFVSNRGIEGLFTSGNYRPNGALRFSWNASRYKNTYVQGSSSALYNKDLSGNMEITMGSRARLTFAPFKQDHRAYTNGALSEGFPLMYQLRTDIFGKNNLFVKYDPTRITFTTSRETDRNDHRVTVGAWFGLSDSLTLSLEKEKNERTNYLSRSVIFEEYNKATLNYDTKLWGGPMYTRLNSFYRTGFNDLGDTTELNIEAELGFEPDPDTRYFIKARKYDLSGTGSNRIDKVEQHISFGIRSSFDTPVVFGKDSTVFGYVYEDSNANGEMDKGERPVSGVTVSAGKWSGVTDKDGYYEIRKLEAGDIEVRLDMMTLSPSTIMTTENPLSVRLNNGWSARADFGVVRKTSLRVHVFKDMNKSGKYDRGDWTARGIKLAVDGVPHITDIYGYVVIDDIQPGPHNLSLDPGSVPQGFLPSVPIRQQIDQKEGETTLIKVPLVDISGKR